MSSIQGSARLAVLPLERAVAKRAESLATRLQVPFLSDLSDSCKTGQYSLFLAVSEDGLHLQSADSRRAGSISVDFGSGAMRHRRRSRGNELLGRAVGVGKKTGLAVLDATAGLGRDSFVLADLGCAVTLCERSPVIAELLAAGLAQARDSGDGWLSGAAGNMRLHSLDARQLSSTELAGLDTIYLDPMFPQRDKSAAVKKEMALLQALLGPEEDADVLLDWALAQDVARVVVKRPPRAPELGAVKPSHCISGKAVRYDVHVLRGLT